MNVKIISFQGLHPSDSSFSRSERYIVFKADFPSLYVLHKTKKKKSPPYFANLSCPGRQDLGPAKSWGHFCCVFVSAKPSALLRIFLLFI